LVSWLDLRRRCWIKSLVFPAFILGVLVDVRVWDLGILGEDLQTSFDWQCSVFSSRPICLCVTSRSFWDPTHCLFGFLILSKVLCFCVLIFRSFSCDGTSHLVLLIGLL
jgi:hypothetical protein